MMLFILYTEDQLTQEDRIGEEQPITEEEKGQEVKTGGDTNLQIKPGHYWKITLGKLE